MSGTNGYGAKDAGLRAQKLRGQVRWRSKQLGIQTTRGGPSGSFSSDASYMIDTALISDSGKQCEACEDISPPTNNDVAAPSVVRQVYLTGSGTWTAPAGVTTVEYLVVGGGGGGGAGSGTGAGGGGGGGSVQIGTFSVTPGTSYSYTVGTGGAGGTTPGGGETDGVVGVDSAFSTVIAKGGGQGYKSRSTNSSGFYGKGGSAQSGSTPTTGGSGGNVRDGGGNPDQGAGGGGGGAGGVGTDSASNTTDNNRGGAGGPGVTSDLQNGTIRTYGAGGKGADEGRPDFIGTLPGANGTANTGNGGGGGASHFLGGNAAVGGNGGSGIVVLKY
jgi:hypothetical protein